MLQLEWKPVIIVNFILISTITSLPLFARVVTHCNYSYTSLEDLQETSGHVRDDVENG